MRGQRRRDLSNERVISVCQKHRQTNPNGWLKSASDELGIHYNAVRSRLKTAGLYAAFQNLSSVPTPALPEGHYVKGVSTLVDEAGNTKLQWVKTATTPADAEALKNAVREAFADMLPVPRIVAPKRCVGDMLTCYPMGDPHIGMFAWAAETGAPFDLEIAERTLIEATRRLVAAAPASKTALIVNLGDFFHSDTSANVTLRSGHPLDVDTRWAKILRVGVRTMRACIEAALERHETVYVINEIGNHDDHTSQMLSVALGLFYEQNPRVVIDDSPAKFHWHRFGKCLIGITHGDTVKPEMLGGIMATDRPQDWGETTHRYWFTGHVHTKRVFELPGCTVESFRTLAAKDSWTTASGYRSGRDMQAIGLHKDWGEVERHRIGIEALEAA